MTQPNLEFDIIRAPEILEKLKNPAYAQNLYAAWCNQEWQKREVFPILSDTTWSVSWRTAGGIVARLRGEGENYMDYYCSGIHNDDELLALGFVTEGVVTDEIKQDLAKLNWYLIPEDTNETI